MIAGHVDRDLGAVAIAAAGLGGIVINELFYGWPAAVALIASVFGGIVGVVWADIFWDGWLSHKRAKEES